MAITEDEKFLLNSKMGSVARKVQLGTLIENAESNAISASHNVVYAGVFTTEGGDAAETIPVVGVLATDICQVMIKTEGSSPVTLDAAACAEDEIGVTMSADPSTDHVLQYVVFRVAT